MIFSVFKTYRDVKKGIKDPTGLGQEMLLDVLKVPLIIFTITGIVALALFFILGWTELLVSSWGFFKFMFVFLLVPFLVLQMLFWSLFARARNMLIRTKKHLDDEIKTIKITPNP